jgi:hypothetical protein
LNDAPQWLGDRLTGAGLAYRNNYRPGGGGGHVNTRWSFIIWVLRPTTGTPEETAARFEYRPLWSRNGVTIFGTGTQQSPVAYFFWRAGGVDTWLQLGWKGSEASRPEALEQADDLRQVFVRIVDEQEKNPYPYESG